MIPFKDRNPTARFAVVTYALLLANVVVYVAVQSDDLLCSVLDYGAVSKELTDPGYELRGCEEAPTAITPLTSMFMHGGLAHLLGNLLFLWVFGNNVEDAMGRVRFIAFYLLGGVAALALQVAVAPGETAPIVGASGAIAAVLGGYIVLYPRARVWSLVLIFPLPVPAFIVLGLWFAQQLLFANLDLTDPTGGAGGVAYFAHIGGFVFGLLTVRAWARRT